MPPTSRPRRSVLLGTTALVSHAYPPYIHQVTPSIQQDPHQRHERGVVGQDAGQLRDDENKDEIEEQLDRADPYGRLGAVDHSVVGTSADAPDAFAAAPGRRPAEVGLRHARSVTAAGDEQRRPRPIHRYGRLAGTAPPGAVPAVAVPIAQRSATPRAGFSMNVSAAARAA